jgi:hypothetical protein
VLAAYFVCESGLNDRHALEYIQCKYPWANPNDNFRAQVATALWALVSISRVRHAVLACAVHTRRACVVHAALCRDMTQMRMSL